MEKTYSKKLAHFIRNTKYSELPAEVVEVCKEVILDYISSLYAGYKEGSRLSQELMNFIIAKEGKKEATIIGRGVKVPVMDAALVNGVLSHVVELDDGHIKALGHPGVTAVTSALTSGEYLKVNGKELIAAVVAGYDIFIRLAMSMNPSHRSLGFHTTGTCGAFSAAAAAGKIYNSNPEQLANALGLAGIQAAGLLEVTEDGQMAKALHPGKASQAGILAVYLANRGVEGPKTIIEGEQGFVKAMARECNYNLLIDELGEKYYILERYVKLYPSCRHTHPPIDAVLALRSENELTPEKIKKVTVRTYSSAVKLTGKIYHPETTAAAKFSIPYCVSTGLVEGRVGLEEFKTEKLNNRRVRDLIDKVKIIVDDNMESSNPRSRGAIVEIIDQNNILYKKQIDLPKGEPEVPVSLEDLKYKFKYCSEGILNDRKREEIIDTIVNIEEIEDINNLTALLTQL